MSYATQELIDALKAARAAKGLSQRALSKRTGVPQSHISKIETGGVDIRLSSLIELARTLDLDLKLVPCKAAAAVDSVVRSTAPAVAAMPAVKELNRTLDTVRNLRYVYPDLSELKKLQNSLQALKGLRNVGRELEALRDIGRPIRKLKQALEKLAGERQGRAEQQKATPYAARIPAEQLLALRRAVGTVQNLHNQLVDTIPEQPLPPRPAYRLDDDGANDDG